MARATEVKRATSTFGLGAELASSGFPNWTSQLAICLFA